MGSELSHANQRTRANVDGSRRSYCHLRNTGKPPKQSDFYYSKSSFGNLYSNFDFLIITKNLGGLAAMFDLQAGLHTGPGETAPSQPSRFLPHQVLPEQSNQNSEQILSQTQGIISNRSISIHVCLS